MHDLPDRWYGGVGSFSYARCLDCGLAQLVNPPTEADIGAYYPTDYIAVGRRAAGLRARLRERDMKPKIELCALQRGRTVLDVGCARGDFLGLMRRHGWVPAGIEPSAHLASQAAAAGLPVWPMPLATAPVPAGVFDLVTLWDVLEHLPDPVSGLQQIHRLLSPSGRLVLNTPVEDGWDARLFGRRWSGWDAPRHTVVFGRATLERALNRAGFRIVKTHRVFETYLITALSLGLMARESLPGPVARAVWSGLHFRGTRLAMEPVWRILDRWLGGSSLAVVAEPATLGARPTTPGSQPDS